MERSQRTWLTLLALPLLLSLDLCIAQRKVKLQEGPLIRAEGRHIAIQCEVSGIQQSVEQNFEWSITHSRNPTLPIQIISTYNSNFPYAMYKRRVEAGEIYIERIKNDSVRLHITNLQKSDEGEFECYTPNTESTYWGSYNALVNLTVIPDTLRATLVPKVLNKVEGDSLELVCEVYKQTPYHTHVAVTWYLQKENQNIRVISLTKGFTLHAGELYKQRQKSGDVQLDKIGTTSFKLTIHKLQKSEQGQFYCHSIEWIQDQDKSWQELTERRTDNVTVNVKSMGKDFLALIKATEVNIDVGGSLEITCIIKAQNTVDRFFSVAWFLNHDEIVRFGSNAVLSLHGEYGMRENSRGVAVRKKTDKEYILKLYQIQVEDGGKYHCQVEESEKVATGAFSSKKSEEIIVIVQQPKSILKVTAITRSPTTSYYGTFSIQCYIQPSSLRHLPASVSWKFQPANSNDSYHLVTFSYDTSIVWGDKEVEFKGKITVEKTASNNVHLRVSRASNLEAGKFLCNAELWKRQHPNEWVMKASATSNIVQVVVFPPVSLLQLAQQESTTRKMINDMVELDCQIFAQTQNDSQFSVTWFFTKSQRQKEDIILNIDRNNIVQYYGEFQNNDQKRKKFQVVKTSKDLYKLIIEKTDVNDGGNYYCHVTEWLLDPNNIWYNVGDAVSARTTVEIHTPGANLHVFDDNKHESISEDAAFELECLIINQTQAQSQFSVTWYFQNEVDPKAPWKKLLQSDRNNILKYYGSLQTNSQKLKFQSAKVSNNNYKLMVQNAAPSDSGIYFCEVEEWVLSSQNQWALQGSNRSGLTTLHVQTSDVTLYSKACASPTLFYFIFVYPFIIFIALIIVAVYFYWNPGKPQTSPKENSLWTPIETIFADPKTEGEASVIQCTE
ncbi:immunoglobulin superfamily member 3-like isoform X2 [Narcine bancroftii]|uniref:immunoglobulin superfamily member 3-like isoform X2 n=1 Tax=Narcine bancroftii TaxID=1343680 RepID=UPI0038318897